MKLLFNLILAAALSVAAVSASEGWLTDFKAAQAQAREQNKPMMLDFTGSDWCAACKNLKKSVFDTPEFKQWAAAKVVLVEVDFPIKTKLPKEQKKANEALEKKYDIEGYPTLLFLDADGKKIGAIEGYEGAKPAEWIAQAEAILAKQKK